MSREAQQSQENEKHLEHTWTSEMKSEIITGSPVSQPFEASWPQLTSRQVIQNKSLFFYATMFGDGWLVMQPFVAINDWYWSPMASRTDYKLQVEARYLVCNTGFFYNWKIWKLYFSNVTWLILIDIQLAFQVPSMTETINVNWIKKA